MSNKFILETTTTYNGRSSTRRDFDLVAFGKELASAIKAPVNISDMGGVTIDCGEDLCLSVRNGYGATLAKVEVYAYTPRGRALETHERPRFPFANVDSGRDMAAIAKDITRRVIEPARPLVTATIEAEDGRKSLVDGLKALCAQLMADFPGLSITHASNDKRADVYFNANGRYLSGSIDVDGRLNIQRFSISTADDARKLFSLIGEA